MKYFFIILIILLFPILIIWVYARIEDYHTYMLLMEIKNVPSVVNFNYDVSSDNAPSIQNVYSFWISFNNGGRMTVRYVNPWWKARKNDSIQLTSVDGNNVIFRDKNFNYYPVVLEIWSEIIGVQLETIIDVVNNYQTISEHVSNWPNLNDYQKNDDEGFFDILNRIIDEKLYTETVMYNEQEIILLKRTDEMSWPW